MSGKASSTLRISSRSIRIQKSPRSSISDGPGGKPYTVFESGAILMYLAEKTGKFLPKDMAQKYEVLQWLMVQLTGIGPMFGQCMHFSCFAPKDRRTTMRSTRYSTEVQRLYDVMEKRLAQSPYIVGNEYTIADIATFPWTRNHDAAGHRNGTTTAERQALVQHDRRRGPR